MPTVLITGANRGMGLEWARAFHRRGWRVLGTARDAQAALELQAVADMVLPCDVSDDASVFSLGRALQDDVVDLLINNAGVLLVDGLHDVSTDTLSIQFNINAIGPLRVVQAILPSLRRSETPRIVNITSRMGSIADNTSGAMYGYRASKAALNMITRSLALDLGPEIPVLALHPGFVQTEMTRGRGDVDAVQAVTRMLTLVDALGPEMSGRFYHRDGHELPW